MKDLELTPCDCDPLHPSWGIRSHSADIFPGDHAWLSWPVVYVYQVPVLALPVLYVPLKDRKTGLLPTRPHFTVKSGFGLDQPVYVTLGDSYDMTLTPGYYFGLPHALGEAPMDSNTFSGVQGPTLETELRYLPNAHTRGLVDLWLIDDLRPNRLPVPSLDPLAALAPDSRDPALMAESRARPARGLRGRLLWQHEQELGAGFYDRADVNLLSDGYLWQDVTTPATGVLELANEYLRSTARVAHLSDNGYAGLDVVLRQDIRFGYHPFGLSEPALPLAVRGNPQLPPASGPDVIGRLPVLTYAVPETPLWGSPIKGALDMSLARLAPLLGQSDREGTLQSFDPVNLPNNPGLGESRWQPGAREGRMRLDLHPTLAVDSGLGPFLRARPYAFLREDSSIWARPPAPWDSGAMLAPACR